MKKLFTKITGLTLGLAMAAGVGVAVSSKKISEAKAVVGEEIYSTGTPSWGTTYACGSQTLTNVSWYVTTYGNNSSIGWNKESQNKSGDATMGPIANVSEKTKYGAYMDKSNFTKAMKISVSIENYDAVSGKWYIFASTDSGSTWSTLTSGTLSTSTTTLEYTHPSSIGDNVRFGFGFGTTSTTKTRINLTGIKVYDEGSATEPSVILDKNSVTLTDASAQVTATAQNITNPVFTWSIKSGSDNCVELSNANTSSVTISPTQMKLGAATVISSVTGDNVTTPIVNEVAVSKKTSASNPLTVAEACAWIDAHGQTDEVHVSGIISQIDSYNSTYKSVQYWISENGTTTNQFEVYSGKNYNNTDFADKTDLTLGMNLVIFGTIKKYGTTYEFDKNNYIVPIAECFASFFLSDTSKVCDASTNNLTKLQGIWGAQKIRYDALSASEKSLLVSGSSTDNMKNALARYDFVCGKYNQGTVNLEEFITGHVIPVAAALTYQHYEIQSTNTPMIIVICCAVASVTALGVLIVIKRRKSSAK